MAAIAGFLGHSELLIRREMIEQMLGSMTGNAICRSQVLSFCNVELELGWLSGPGGDDCFCAWNERKDTFLLFKGEHFGDKFSLRKYGNEQNAENSSTAAQLLRLYDDIGLDLLTQLNGCFTGVIVDVRRKNVILFNDRYGLGRFYYYNGPEGFYFSSEAKALLKVVPSLRSLDIRGVGEFLSCDCVLQNRTLFDGVFVLPPGAAWTFGPNCVLQKCRYFDPSSWEAQPQLRCDDYHQSLREIFPRILARQLPNTDPIAMSLTGGLDGRLIMAWCRPQPDELPCYTFGSCFGETADVRIAREVAAVCGQSFIELRVNGTFLSQFPELAQEAILISDGMMDVTGTAELYVNRLARNIRPIRLTGNYGSEILRGNVTIRAHKIFEPLFNPVLIEAAHEATTTFAEEFRGNRRSFIAFKQTPWHHFARSSIEKSQLTVRSPYLDNELVALSFQAPARSETNFEICLKMVAEGNSKLAMIPTDRGVQYRANILANRLRQLRERFLIKAEYAYDYGMPNWLAQVDRLFFPLQLERVFLGRQKFCHFRTWYRGRLAPYVKEILLDSRTLTRPYLRRRAVERMVVNHVKGTANFTTEIHKLLTLELTQRLLLERA